LQRALAPLPEKRALVWLRCAADPPVELNDTVPVGVQVSPLASFTVAVQVDVFPILTVEGEHTTVVGLTWGVYTYTMPWPLGPRAPTKIVLPPELIAIGSLPAAISRPVGVVTTRNSWDQVD